jgi:hypothetical protein
VWFDGLFRVRLAHWTLKEGLNPNLSNLSPAIVVEGLPEAAPAPVSRRKKQAAKRSAGSAFQDLVSGSEEEKVEQDDEKAKQVQVKKEKPQAKRVKQVQAKKKGGLKQAQAEPAPVLSESESPVKKTPSRKGGPKHARAKAVLSESESPVKKTPSRKPKEIERSASNGHQTVIKVVVCRSVCFHFWFVCRQEERPGHPKWTHDWRSSSSTATISSRGIMPQWKRRRRTSSIRCPSPYTR